MIGVAEMDIDKCQAIVIENKIFVPCTFTEEESNTLYGYSSLKRKGWVTPNLHYLYTDKVIELEAYGKYHNFKIQDKGLDIEKIKGFRFVPTENIK